MIDSEFWESVVVVDEASVPVADELVVANGGGQGEQATRDAGHEAGHGVRAVAFEGELALEAVDDRFDPLAHGTEFAEAAWLVLAIGPQQPAAHLLDHGLELAAGEALIGEDRAPRDGSAPPARTSPTAWASRRCSPWRRCHGNDRTTAPSPTAWHGCRFRSPHPVRGATSRTRSTRGTMPTSMTRWTSTTSSASQRSSTSATIATSETRWTSTTSSASRRSSTSATIATSETRWTS